MSISDPAGSYGRRARPRARPPDRANGAHGALPGADDELDQQVNADDELDQQVKGQAPLEQLDLADRVRLDTGDALAVHVEDTNVLRALDVL
jgi:hypothetical protein